jgi:hypothetical protein
MTQRSSVQCAPWAVSACGEVAATPLPTRPIATATAKSTHPSHGFMTSIL